MNDNTFYRYAAGGRSSTDQMIPQMALIAQRHGLGLLVIDEIQNLSNAKSGGAEKMLSFLVQLVNTIGVPVLLVGTPNAVPFLSSNLMTIRRSAGQQGMTKLHSLAVDSVDWQMLTKGLWKYQWTTNRSPLTEEIKTAWHGCCLPDGKRFSRLQVRKPKPRRKFACVTLQKRNDIWLIIELCNIDRYSISTLFVKCTKNKDELVNEIIDKLMICNGSWSQDYFPSGTFKTLDHHKGRSSERWAELMYYKMF